MSKLDRLAELLDAEAKINTEKTYIVKSLLLVFAVLFLRLTMGGFLFFSIVSFAIFNYAVYLWINTDLGIWGIIKKNISFVDAPEVEGDKRNKKRPWGTWGLVAVNSFIFLFVQSDENYDFMRDNFYFPPADINLINLPISLFTSMYLHGDLMHLFGNMCFLWGIGTALEKRIGTRQFLKLYHLTGIFGAITATIVAVLFTESATPGLGASGAISGVMGIFLVRCYFKRMTFPIPAFGILPLKLNMQLNGLVVPLIYFSFDLGGGLRQVMEISYSNVGYLDHMFGFIFGVRYAWRMKLMEKAIAERHLDIGDAVFDGKTLLTKGFEAAGGLDGARKSLLIALEKEPDNPDTLLALARVESYLVRKPEGMKYYQKAIKNYFPETPEQAVEVFREYYPKYRGMLEPSLQYRIAAMLQRQGHLELSEQALMQLANNQAVPQEIREQSLFYSGRILEQQKLPEPAERYYRRFIDEFPRSPYLETVQARLAQLPLPVRPEAYFEKVC